MREETQLEPICAICKQPITQEQWPYRTLANGEKAHLACDPGSTPDEERKPAP